MPCRHIMFFCVMLWDSGLVRNIFIFPEVLVALKSLKRPTTKETKPKDDASCKFPAVTWSPDNDISSRTCRSCGTGGLRCLNFWPQFHFFSLSIWSVLNTAWFSKRVSNPAVRTTVLDLDWNRSTWMGRNHARKKISPLQNCSNWNTEWPQIDKKHGIWS